MGRSGAIEIATSDCLVRGSQWWIQKFHDMGCQLPRWGRQPIFWPYFQKNCVQIGAGGGEAHTPLLGSINGSGQSKGQRSPKCLLEYILKSHNVVKRLWDYLPLCTDFIIWIIGDSYSVTLLIQTGYFMTFLDFSWLLDFFGDQSRWWTVGRKGQEWRLGGGRSTRIGECGPDGAGPILPIWYPISPIWYPISPVWYTISPVWYPISPIWYTISPVWYTIPYLAPRPCYLVSHPW